MLIIVVRPSNNRNWNIDQKILPEITRDGNEVTIKKVRNFSYTTTSDFTPAYYDDTYDISKLKSAYFVVEPFSGNFNAAHTFVTFEFDESNRITGNTKSKFLSVSVEIRKEKGESFSAVKGLLRQYELMIVIADEADVIKLRTNYRKDKVYLYPIIAPREKIVKLFNGMLERAKQLQKHPEFYNTLTNTCTTNIVDQVNAIASEDKKIPFDFRVLMPANSDALAQQMGFIDNSLSLEQVREKYYITEKALACPEAEGIDFSLCIRQ